MRIQCLLLGVLCVSPVATAAGGLISDENFLVQAPSDDLAREVLQRASAMRREVAVDLLDGELADGAGRTSLQIKISASERSGYLWPASQTRKTHSLWLICTAEEATGSWLKRNVAHLVLQTAYPERLPPWAREGLAAGYDGEALRDERWQLLNWFDETGRWPDLANLLRDDYLAESDHMGTTAAASLCEFLAQQHGRAKVLKFALAGSQTGWSAALRSHFGIDGVGPLQNQWQQWVVESIEQRGAATVDEFADARHHMNEHDSPLARSVNFTVFAEDRQLSLQVLESAERLRREMAEELFGRALPPGVGRTLVYVELTHAEDRASTKLQDAAQRVPHVLSIATSPDRLEFALGHEVAHIVLATQYAYELPIWVHEGIASGRDDPQRKAQRRQMIASMANGERLPNLAGLLAAERLEHTDLANYALASSLTEFLLTRGDTAKLLRFAVDGKAQGWDAALQAHYKIANTGQLQAAWRNWLD